MKAIIISKDDVTYSAELVMEGDKIEFVSEFRYLGVLVDQHLNLKPHRRM